jgi:selenide,water dikinase
MPTTPVGEAWRISPGLPYRHEETGVPAVKRIVLCGGGHAHVHVLQAFAKAPVPGAEVTLVSPFPRQIYSGMVPGWISGRYPLDACTIALPPLAEAARVRWVRGEAVSLDAAHRRLRLADGTLLDYDVLSLDTGSVQRRDRIPGAAEHALFVRPMETFATRWQALQQEIEFVTSAEGGRRLLAIAVVGGGAGGVELALALHHRLAGAARVTLVSGPAEPVPTHPAGTRSRVAEVLRRQRIPVMRMTCVAIADREVVLRSPGGAHVTLASDLTLLATGADAPAWIADSGLALDEAGFVATGPTLQSRSHPEVFAAGDVSSRTDAPHPRSGVFAVRAGPPLAVNLARFATGGALERWRPQRRSLNLLACGDGTAIASWGPFSAQGGWVWRWKDRIDRGFIARYRVGAPAGPAA